MGTHKATQLVRIALQTGAASLIGRLSRMHGAVIHHPGYRTSLQCSGPKELDQSPKSSLSSTIEPMSCTYAWTIHTPSSEHHHSSSLAHIWGSCHTVLKTIEPCRTGPVMRPVKLALLVMWQGSVGGSICKNVLRADE